MNVQGGPEVGVPPFRFNSIVLFMVDCLYSVTLKSFKSHKHRYEHHPCRNTAEFCAKFSQMFC